MRLGFCGAFLSDDMRNKSLHEAGQTPADHGVYLSIEDHQLVTLESAAVAAISILDSQQRRL